MSGVLLWDFDGTLARRRGGWSGARPEYMGWKELSEVANAGHQVQSHGWSHALLTHCTPEQLTQELRRSRGAEGMKPDTRIDCCAVVGIVSG